MTDKTALLRKASFGLRCVLTGAVLVLFSTSAARATPPAANAQNVKGSMDSPISITLTGSDEDADTLTYEIVQQPAHGTLSGTPPNVTYTSSDDEPSDSFTFRVCDGILYSSPAKVGVERYIDPDESNLLPTGHNQVLTILGSGSITLTGSDAEGDPITFQIVDSPNCGTLSGSAPNVTYIYDSMLCSYPPQTDGFSFQVESSGRTSGDLARVDIYLTSNPPGPVTNAGPDLNVATGQGTILNGTYHDPAELPISYQNWTCTDPDGINCCDSESTPDGSYCSYDCTFDNPTQADPTFTALNSGTFNCDYFVENNQDYSYDRLEIEAAVDAPSAQTGTIVLLVGFCALIGVRHVRKSVRKNV